MSCRWSLEAAIRPHLIWSWTCPVRVIQSQNNTPTWLAHTCWTCRCLIMLHRTWTVLFMSRTGTWWDVRLWKERTTSCSRHACVMQKILFCLWLLFLYGTTSKYLTMDITDTSDDDELVSGLSHDSDVSLIEDICFASWALSFRENKLIVTRMNWHCHI